jgi:catechol 2,3-dioxygenase-like lactoylglutathione lyase family enzyme
MLSGAASVLLVFGAMAPVVQADGATDDYVQLSVPNLDQAVNFFQSVMGCDPIDPSSDASSAILQCAQNVVVELSPAAPARKSAEPVAPVRFRTDDAASAAAWLRSRHVKIMAPAAQVGADRRDELPVTVDFVTPWGQPIELVGHPVNIAPIGSRARLASD